ncbi:MAG: iron-sulfur cluster biosynthesis transcriptional regulator SufR [Cyanothece sp. SIO1E1]|nr:iron-sulfur cluster biosynthesis transcriptional regulator SufR [Cyanothece sp. SIO1E1]
MVTTQQPSTKQDILQHLLKQGQATAQELADHLQVSPQAIRRHLKDLEFEELIEHQVVQAGMGRPNHFYQLSRKGRDRLPAQYDQFAISLIDTLTETIGPEQVSTVLSAHWKRRAIDYRQRVGKGPLSERIIKLVDLRRAEGYMAEYHIVEPEAENPADNPRFIVTEYNCAISHIAESFPNVCGHELEMFATVLPDCSVERTHWLIDGEHHCGYLIQMKG